MIGRDCIDRRAPALLAVLLTLLSGAPLHVGWLPLLPPMAWVTSLVIGMLTPQAMGLGFAVLVGLLQDAVWGVPLGCFGGLNLLLMLALRTRPTPPSLRAALPEAATMLSAASLALWLLLAWLHPAPPPIRMIPATALLSLLWFAALYHLHPRRPMG